jgi:primosomal protein N' (replication factor Y)
MPEASPQTAAIWPLTGFSRALSYKLPNALVESLEPGCLVRIPLGRRSELGIVKALDPELEIAPERLKFVHTLEQPFPVLSADLLQLAPWMAHYYAASLENVFEVMIPGAVRKGMRLAQRKVLQVAEPLPADELKALTRRAPQQAKLYQFLASQLSDDPLPKNKILQRLEIPASSADALIKKGVLRETTAVQRKTAYDDDLSAAEIVAKRAIQLTEKQEAAAAALRAGLGRRAFERYLLHGVTGSGKTEVYLDAMEHALKDGGSVIFLVPEVALTPQTVSRLRVRLEPMTRVVVWHSHLSDGERYDAWHALATGEARVVVGARSAIFAPMKDLRLIIVDEEHEPAYKQEETPRYHGRDVAVYRAHLNQALCVLGSATPSLESLHNAREGKYQLLQLRERIDHRQLPLIHVVDMVREKAKGKGPAIFSPLLAEKMRQRHENGEQAILFLNRRGYDASLKCPDCGYVAMCEHCDLTLTHHRSDHILRCHLCGYEDLVPRSCPQCKSPKIVYRGSGTQKIEDLARKIIPGARIVRIDADTMQKKNLFREILGDFRRGKIDVLVGTQMIAKGLDFPNVTLVGLLDADLSLHMPDFRAAERTFQLLVQVAGRAGRGDRAGEVVVQTSMPYAPAIQFARQQDFEGFAADELANRAEFHYPPYRHLIHHLFRSKNPEKVKFYAQQWVKHVEEILAPEFPALEIRGPAPCPIEKIKDHYRYQLWYFTPGVTRLVGRLQELRSAFKWDKEMIEVLDVDAVGLV